MLGQNNLLSRDTAQYSYDFVPAQLRLDKDRPRRALPKGKVERGRSRVTCKSFLVRSPWSKP